ncbi:hypothetical protein B0H34DRAFT_793383 [Crassisporium funariophilum]|nr:hypothetical protein B0H34DRAFT_793383 [Crassisporium funariophilum]
MPKTKEFRTDFVHIEFFISETPDKDRVLQDIYVDATGPELSSHPPGSLAAAGHVYPLESSSQVKRGGTTSEEKKTLVYPPKYATAVGAPKVPISLHSLLLAEVDLLPRALILCFQEKRGQGPSYWCQIQLCTHTNAQIYSMDEWKNAICKVDRSARGFKVGFAFKFQTHVLAFVTIDILVQLMVYGKDCSNHSHRFKRLLSQYKSCIDSHPSGTLWVHKHGAPGAPYDVFEPDYIQQALVHNDLLLGALIFGDDAWKHLCTKAGLEMDEIKPNTRSILVLVDRSKTWLQLEAYDVLFNGSSGHQGMTSWSRPYVYRISKSNVWSVIPVYPKLSIPDIPDRPCQPLPGVEVELLDNDTRSSLLLQNVTQHWEVYTVGPLDFCGVAQIITGPGGKKIVMACKMDPWHPEYYVQKHILSAATAKLRRNGREKKVLIKKQRQLSSRKFHANKVPLDWIIG